MEVLLLLVHLQEELPESRVGIPVDVPEIVAGDILPKVREFNAGSAFLGDAVCPELSANDPLCDQRKVFQPRQEFGVEEFSHHF